MGHCARLLLVDTVSRYAYPQCLEGVCRCRVAVRCDDPCVALLDALDCHERCNGTPDCHDRPVPRAVVPMALVSADLKSVTV